MIHHATSGLVPMSHRYTTIEMASGITLCQSFIPADAVHLSDTDFAPGLQEYQQLYMSKEMAKMFSADHFMEGGGNNRTPVTPGTVQILYYYSSFGDHTEDAQITSCDIELGEPNELGAKS